MQKAIDFYKPEFITHKKRTVGTSFRAHFHVQDVAKMLTKCS